MKLKLRRLLVAFCSLIFSISNAQNYEWGNVPIGGGGFVSAIIPSQTVPNLMYARTDVGGAYRWNADDEEWIPLTDWVSEDQVGLLGIESLAIDEESPNKLYMLAGISYFNNGNTAILKSEDYGESYTLINVSNQFKAHGNGMGRQTGEKLQIDPNNSNILYCGTRWDGLFKSTDEGMTWSHMNGLNVSTTPNENGISFVLIDPSSESNGQSQTIYIGVSRTTDNLYKSTDGGQSFSLIANAPTGVMPQRAKLASDGSLFITYGDGAGPHGHWAVPEPMETGAIWKLNTSNDNWSNITPSGYTRAFGGISVDPNNPQRLVASTINAYFPQDNAWGDRIFYSTNGGTSWTDVMDNGVDIIPNGISWIDGHAIHWAGSIEFDPFNTNMVWVTSGNGIFKNSTIAASPSIWDFTVSGLEETVPLDIFSIENGPLVSVIGDYDGYTHSDVTNYAPIHQPRMGTTTGLDVAYQNTDTRVRVGNELYVTTNGGTTWNQGTINGEKGKVALSADGAVILHCAEQSNTTYRSDNNGSSWTTVSGLSISDAKPTQEPNNSDVFYAYNPSNGSFYRSTDKGISFSQTTSIGSNGSNIIRVNPYTEGDIWVPLYNGGLTRSTNSGTSFSKINSVDQCGAVGFGKAAPGSNYPALYIWGTINGTEGVYRSIDEGVSWTRINDDDHQYGGPGNGKFVIGDLNEFGRVYMSTAGRGIVTGFTSGVDCAQVPNGTASYDNCGVCSGGSTGITPNSTCEQDCNNEWDGTATLDNCNVCSGGSTGIEPNSTCPQPCDVAIKDTTVCQAGDITLSIMETGDFNWFDENEVFLSDQNDYVFDVSGNATLYVERVQTQTQLFGESAQTGTGWGDNTFPNDDKKIKIIVDENVTLKSVSVFTTAANTDIVININSLAGAYQGSGSVNSTIIGKVKVPLDIVLEPGEYLIDAVGTSASLFYQSESGAFPYSVDGIISFTYNAAWATTWYGFFYDWEIETGKSCLKTPVEITLDPQDPSCNITGTSDDLNEVRLYPNPFNNHLSVELNSAFHYSIHSIQGQLVTEGKCNDSNCAIGEGLENGIYQLIIQTDSDSYSQTIIKQ